MKRTIRVTIAYDGTDFAGWQVQSEQRTVQGVVQAALERIHGHLVRVSAAGRTDAGVHAIGQVVGFKTEIDSLTPEVLPVALNSFLPKDVRVLDARVVGDQFDARRSARLRVYRYQLLSGRQLPHLQRYAFWIRRSIRLEVLNRLAAAIIGEHDFTTFAASGWAGTSAVRHVVQASFFVEGPMIIFRIAATSFLWKMVRSLVGTMLEIESDTDKESAEAEERMSELLSNRIREQVGQTAPPWGLFLERVFFADDMSRVKAPSMDNSRLHGIDCFLNG